MKRRRIYPWLIEISLTVLIISACQSSTPPVENVSRIVQPRIISVTANQWEIPNYGMLELEISLAANYDNPYDVRQVALEAVFTGPDGRGWQVPGFWDANKMWRVRFTPSLAGDWRYSLTVRDQAGISKPWEDKFKTITSESHGWLQVGSWVNPAYSPYYLAYHDGAPFYGIGHCEAFDLMSIGFDETTGFALFDQMAQAGENMVVYWPVYSNPFFNNSYDRYSLPDLKVIDMVVQDAQKKGIFLVFTVWDHPELRDKPHPWGGGNWPYNNGFRLLGDVNSFFRDEEMWAWQENLYRYIIARWGYSPAIGLWQTVSEINGTNAGSQTDTWHKRVNDYFVQNDPYRHPTTASMSGDTDWPEGFKVMDIPQVHVYDFKTGPIGASQQIARWTVHMWEAAAKPNFVGEFGTSGNQDYPELLHNAIWAGLASGAAITPMEWNDGSQWARMTTDMMAHMTYFQQFVSDLPLVQLNPKPVEVASRDPKVRAWGMGGPDWGVVWVQDYSLEGKPIAEVRQNRKPATEATLLISGLDVGDYLARPYDTWQGIYLSSYPVHCSEQECEFSLPDFTGDLAIKFSRD